MYGFSDNSGTVFPRISTLLGNVIRCYVTWFTRFSVQNQFCPRIFVCCKFQTFLVQLRRCKVAFDLLINPHFTTKHAHFVKRFFVFVARQNYRDNFLFKRKTCADKNLYFVIKIFVFLSFISYKCNNNRTRYVVQWHTHVVLTFWRTNLLWCTNWHRVSNCRFEIELYCNVLRCNSSNFNSWNC